MTLVIDNPLGDGTIEVRDGDLIPIDETGGRGLVSLIVPSGSYDHLPVTLRAIQPIGDGMIRFHGPLTTMYEPCQWCDRMGCDPYGCCIQCCQGSYRELCACRNQTMPMYIDASIVPEPLKGYLSLTEWQTVIAPVNRALRPSAARRRHADRLTSIGTFGAYTSPCLIGLPCVIYVMCVQCSDPQFPSTSALLDVTVQAIDKFEIPLTIAASGGAARRSSGSMPVPRWRSRAS